MGEVKLLEKDYPNNSRKARTEQKEEDKRERRLDSVAKANVRTPKRNSKLAELFIAEDILDIKEFLVKEVVVPTIKEMIVGSVEMLFFGEYRGKKNKKKRTDYTRASYEDDRPYRRSRDSDRSRRTRFDFDSIAFSTRAEAEEIVDILCDQLEDYDYVTVGEFYDLAGIDAEATDDDWGWKDLSSVKAVRTRYGDWILSMPRPREVR